MTKAAPFFIFIFLFILSACSNNVEHGSNNSANIKEISANLNDPDSPEKKANDHIEELGDLIKLPYEVTETKWREENTNGIRKLAAVIRFDKNDADKLESDSAKHGEPQDVEIALQEWYPSELKTQSEFSDNSILKGKAYLPNEILTPPFTTGRLIRIDDNDYFIIEIEGK